MGLYQLYEKLGASPEQTARSKRKRLKAESRTETSPEPLISHEIMNELQAQLSAISESQKAFIECIVAVTNARVSAQRLCYRLDSDLYSFYNNPESREQLKVSRLQVQGWIRDIQQQILSLDAYVGSTLPASTSHRKRHKKTVYEIKRTRYVRLLHSLIAEFVAILDQQKQDLKEVCNDYCQFITEQYHTVNQYISPQEVKVFISYLNKPLLLPKSPEKSELAPDLVGNPYIKTIVTEILYRRQDLHLILDTLRLIDSVSPSLKLIEHRFILNSFSQGYRDEYLDEDDDDQAFLPDEESDSDSSRSSAELSEEDLLVISHPKSLTQRLLAVFGNRPKNRLDCLDNSDNEDEEYDAEFDKEYDEMDIDDSEHGSMVTGGGSRMHEEIGFRLLPGGESIYKPSLLDRARRVLKTKAGRHLLLALLLLLGTLALVIIMILEILHF